MRSYKGSSWLIERFIFFDIVLYQLKQEQSSASLSKILPYYLESKPIDSYLYLEGTCDAYHANLT